MEDREGRELKALRSMAWCRAVGELESMLPTYWNNDGQFEEMKKLLELFVTNVENAGLNE